MTKKKQNKEAEQALPETSEEQEMETRPGEEGEDNSGQYADAEAPPDEGDPGAGWQKEKEELLDKIKRKQADLDNLRRISKLEQAEAREYALQDFLRRLLPVLDNLERGLESAREAEDVPASYCEGLEMIHRQLLQLLEQEGVSPIEACGEPFDPNCHHAVLQVESAESEPGTVLEELQRGYRHRRRILRPAMVKVCGGQ